MKKLFKRLSLLLVSAAVALSTCVIPSYAAGYANTYKNTGNQRADIIGVAKTQVGNTNSSHKYRSDNLGWCSSFIVWCARQANISSSIIKTTGCADAADLGVTYKGRSADRKTGINYTPQSGDIIIFDWADKGYCYKSPASEYGDHVGLVEYVKDGKVYTIEGNNNGKVRKCSYLLNDKEIKGYGVPNYKNSASSSSTQSYKLSFSGKLDGSDVSNISGIATADVYINNKLVKNDCTGFSQSYPKGTSYKITDIKPKSGYSYTGAKTISGTLNSTQNIKLTFARTKWSANFKMKAGAYINAYDSVNGSKVGRIYPNDVVTVSEIYTSGWIKMSCPWSNGKNKTVYAKTSDFKFKATKYINAYSGQNSNKVGRVYPKDLVTIQTAYNSGYLKCLCPWTNNTVKTIYIKYKDIY